MAGSADLTGEHSWQGRQDAFERRPLSASPSLPTRVPTGEHIATFWPTARYRATRNIYIACASQVL